MLSDIVEIPSLGSAKHVVFTALFVEASIKEQILPKLHCENVCWEEEVTGLMMKLSFALHEEDESGQHDVVLVLQPLWQSWIAPKSRNY